MRILKSIYEEIINNVPEHMPESGGMLGGNNNTITSVVFDEGKQDEFRHCHYTPNVKRLNSILLEWAEKDIEFYGLFHTHFHSVSTLSEGDIIYIKNILDAMPESKKLLYFPIVVLPEKEIISYCCTMNGSELNIVQDSVECVETL